MHITCDMAMDLAGLYKDNIASPDSARAVEQHLRTCPACRRYYRNFRVEANPAADKVREAAVVAVDPTEQEWKQFSHRVGRHRMVSRVVSVTMVVVGVLTLMGGIVSFLQRGRKK